MALRYNKSTYAELIDDLRFDLHGAELTALPDEAIQLYILQAEQSICEQFPVFEEYALTISDDVSDYQFQDRPPITSTAAPMGSVMATSVGHSLASQDNIRVIEVLGETGANGNWSVLRSTDDVFALVTSVTGGTYASGGRYWKTNEIPNYFRDFTSIKRVWSSLTYTVEVVSIDDITRRVALDGMENASGYTAPLMAAVFRKDGKRYLKFYPTPTDSQTVTLYGQVQIVPRDYSSDPLTTQIHLSTDYNEIIKAFAKWKIVGSWLKDPKAAAAEFEGYRYHISQFRRTMPSHRRRAIIYE
jgi:hypothetical protein